MYHPETMYELAKLRIAEDLRQAEHERLVRAVKAPKATRVIDPIPFRTRLARLFGAVGSATRAEAEASEA